MKIKGRTVHKQGVVAEVPCAVGTAGNNAVRGCYIAETADLHCTVRPQDRLIHRYCRPRRRIESAAAAAGCIAADGYVRQVSTAGENGHPGAISGDHIGRKDHILKNRGGTPVHQDAAALGAAAAYKGHIGDQCIVVLAAGYGQYRAGAVALDNSLIRGAAAADYQVLYPQVHRRAVGSRGHFHCIQLVG